jgi:hypothetical protein
MAAANTSTLSNVLKQLYPQSYLWKVLYENNPWFGMVPKSEDFGGRDLRLSLMYAPTSGRSQDFTAAQAQKAGARYAGFTLTRNTDYSLFSITTEAIRASKGNANSLVEGLKAEGDAALYALKRSASTALFGNGGGAVGQIASTSTNTLTLVNASDIVNFEVGDTIVPSLTDGTSGVVIADPQVITAIDRDLGVLTKTGNWNAGNYANDSFVFHVGDFGAKIRGLAAWLPATAPALGVDSFFGMDRGIDPTRLAGVRYVADTTVDSTMERCFINASARVAREGGRPDLLLCNPVDRARLVNEIGAKTKYDKQTATSPKGQMASIGYETLVIDGGGGRMDVVADLNCPQNRCYMLQKDTWKLFSLGAMPGWLTEDGAQVLREASADALEGRLGYYAQLGCQAPGWNATIDISALTED